MPEPAPQSFRRVAIKPAMACALLACLLFLGGAFSLIDSAQRDILLLATDTREHILPAVQAQQRTAFNLERLRVLAEIIDSTSDPERRRLALASAQALSYEFMFEHDPRLTADMARVFAIIRNIHDLRERGQDPAVATPGQTWEQANAALQDMSSHLTVDAALTADRRVAGIADAARHAVRMAVLLLVLGGALAGLFSMLFLRQVMRPIEQATQGLAQAKSGGGRVALPRSPVRELDNILRGVEELGEVLAELETATRAKSVFLANMSHEIRTPLSGILGMLEVTARQESDPEKLRRLGMMREAAESLADIVGDILDYSRIEAGKVRIQTEPFRLVDLAGRVERLFEHQARAKGLDFVLALPAEPTGLLLGDPTRLGQVLVNLVGNAVKFTPAGQVRLDIARVQAGEGRPGETVLEFTVWDTGVGIAATDLGRLFQPFSQVDDSMAKAQPGTGLGLVISRQLVEGMGGQLTVESVPGQGARFSFTLRFVPAPDDAGASPAGLRPRPARPPAASLDVLLVEDNLLNREAIAFNLREEGRRVTLALDGREALAQVRAHRFSVILLDIQMPEVDGLHVLTTIRSGEAGDARTPVIVLTAYAHEREKAAILAAGADAVLTKPIDFAALDELLAAYETPLPPASAGPEPPRSEEDHDLAVQLREFFRQDTPQRLEAYHRFLREGDLAGAGAVVHYIANSAIAISDPALVQACKGLEESLLRRHPQAREQLHAAFVREAARALRPNDSSPPLQSEPEDTP